MYVDDILMANSRKIETPKLKEILIGKPEIKDFNEVERILRMNTIRILKKI